MGASVKVEGNVAVISGVEKFTGARVNAPDLRAGAALVIAGLAAEGITIVDDIYYIERGYENLDEKLRKLGAQIEKVASGKRNSKIQTESWLIKIIPIILRNCCILEENKVQFSTSKRTAVQRAVKTGSGRQWYQRKIICRCG